MNSRRRSNKQKKTAPRYHNRVVGLFITRRCVLLLLVAATILARPSWQAWHSYVHIRTIETQLEQLIRLEGSTAYRDEVLAMSAKMAAATQKLKWASRHEGFGPRGWCFPENDAANARSILMVFGENKLDTMENEAIDLVRQGEYDDAEALLQSPEYEEQRQAYNEGMKAFISNMRGTLVDRRAKHWQKIRQVLKVVSIVLPVITFALLLAKRRQRHLREREVTKLKLNVFAKEWQKTFNAISDGVCIVDKSGGKILQCNMAMTKFLKLPYKEIIGRSCCELLHGSPEPAKMCPLVRMCKTSRIETTDFEVGDKWLRIKVYPLKDNNGQIVRAVHIASDITEQKKANRALQESENKFRLAFANAQDAIVWIDVESGECRTLS